jgi:hypothetical protein
MKTKIAFPERPSVPTEIPMFATSAPAWNEERVTELAMRFDVRGAVVDAGNWFVMRDGVHTLEVYQASHSLRLTRDDFDAEARSESRTAPDRVHALATADRFHRLLGGTDAHTELHSVTELEVMKAVKRKREPERCVVGLQVNYRYMLDGIPLIGPGAKAQITVGRDGELAQAYRFWRDVKPKGARRAIPVEQVFKRFTAAPQFSELSGDSKIKVTSVRFGLLCLPPTEVQSVLLPAYVLRGEISTRLLPRYEFVTYLAAVHLDEADAKRNRWSLTRPSLLVSLSGGPGEKAG